MRHFSNNHRVHFAEESGKRRNLLCNKRSRFSFSKSHLTFTKKKNSSRAQLFSLLFPIMTWQLFFNFSSCNCLCHLFSALFHKPHPTPTDSKMAPKNFKTFQGETKTHLSKKCSFHFASKILSFRFSWLDLEQKKFDSTPPQEKDIWIDLNLIYETKIQSNVSKVAGNLRFSKNRTILSRQKADPPRVKSWHKSVLRIKKVFEKRSLGSGFFPGFYGHIWQKILSHLIGKKPPLSNDFLFCWTKLLFPGNALVLKESKSDFLSSRNSFSLQSSREKPLKVKEFRTPKNWHIINSPVNTFCRPECLKKEEENIFAAQFFWIENMGQPIFPAQLGYLFRLWQVSLYKLLLRQFTSSWGLFIPAIFWYLKIW